VLVPPRGLVATTVCVLLATAALAVLWAPPVRASGEPKLRLDTWQASERELLAMQAEADGLLRLPFAATATRAQAELQATLSLWLRDELAHDGDADRPEARVLLGNAEERARTLVLTAGPDALRAQAVRFGRSVRARLEAAIAAAQARGMELGAFLRLQPPPPQVRALTELAGAIGQPLAAAGIERWQRDGRLEPAAARIVESLAAQRLLALGVRVPGGAPTLPSDAALQLLRFRVEAHDGLALPRKLELLDDLAREDPTYPETYATGALLGRAGQFAACAVWFRQAAMLGQRARQAQVNAAWCEGQVASR